MNKSTLTAPWALGKNQGVLPAVAENTATVVIPSSDIGGTAISSATIEVYKNLAAGNGLTTDRLGDLYKHGFRLSGAESRNELLAVRIR
jgi:hypothetical protein